jgi:hypothetical protein
MKEVEYRITYPKIKVKLYEMDISKSKINARNIIKVLSVIKI